MSTSKIITIYFVNNTHIVFEDFSELDSSGSWLKFKRGKENIFGAPTSSVLYYSITTQDAIQQKDNPVE